jgi:hypothetical protein
MINGREKHLGLTTRRLRCFFFYLNKERKSHISVHYKQGEWKQTNTFFAAILEKNNISISYPKTAGAINLQ